MGSDNLSNEIHWPLKISLTTLILSLALSIFKFYVVGHKTNYCHRPINYYQQLFCTLSAESFLCLLDFGILSGGGQGGWEIVTSLSPPPYSIKTLSELRKIFVWHAQHAAGV